MQLSCKRQQTKQATNHCALFTSEAQAQAQAATPITPSPLAQQAENKVYKNLRVAGGLKMEY